MVDFSTPMSMSMDESELTQSPHSFMADILNEVISVIIYFSGWRKSVKLEPSLTRLLDGPMISEN